MKQALYRCASALTRIDLLHAYISLIDRKVKIVVVLQTIWVDATHVLMDLGFEPQSLVWFEQMPKTTLSKRHQYLTLPMVCRSQVLRFLMHGKRFRIS